MSKEKLEQINKALCGEKDWYVNKINALKESASKEELSTFERNRNDKRYEEPFEDDGAYCDECD